jgi:hypothetical protein
MMIRPRARRESAPMTVNPFEPPRAAEAVVPGIDGDPASALPTAALGELVSSGPWVRWAARLALVSAVVGLLNSGFSLSRATATAEKVGAVFGIVLGVPIALLFVLLFRRYASHVERLRDRQPGALPGVVDSQRVLFKTFGIFIIIGLAAVPLMIAGVVAAVLVTKGGAR